MRKPELELHEPAGSWRKTNGGARDGIWEQILAADPLTGDSTLVQRYEPGAGTASGMIVHGCWEAVMILLGEITDLTLGKLFRPACTRAARPHGPRTLLERTRLPHARDRPPLTEASGTTRHDGKKERPVR